MSGILYIYTHTKMRWNYEEERTASIAENSYSRTRN